MATQAAAADLADRLIKQTSPHTPVAPPRAELSGDERRLAAPKAIGIAAMMSLPFWAVIAAAVYSALSSKP